MSGTKGMRPEMIDRHGYHTAWCADYANGPHDPETPYCELQIGGIDAVENDGFGPVQLWVTAIRPFLHGQYAPKTIRAEERNRNGIQLTCLVRDQNNWVATHFNIRSGEARTLAALLIAGADILDGIDRTVHTGGPLR